MVSKFPLGLRPPTLEERAEYYQRVFPVRKALSWVKSFVKIDTGRDSRIVKPGLKPKLLTLKPPYTAKRLREKLLKYLPEDVYYDLNCYRSIQRCLKCRIFFGAYAKKPIFCWWNCSNWLCQEMAFDIDPENFRRKPLEDMRSFTLEELEAAKEATLQLYEWLKQQGARRLRVIFSGRGFHVVVRDYWLTSLTYSQRKKFTEKMPEELQEAIDPWVTWGNIRLLRLPYSLHGLVGLVTLPIAKHHLYLDAEELIERARVQW